MKFKLYIMSLVISLSGTLTAQTLSINEQLIHKTWTAYWITDPAAAQREYGIYHFRKSFSLSAVPSSFIIHVSADNRYRLFVNGKAICSGPARGDLFNWYYETVDLAPYLKSGTNTIAAQVWNMGILAPVAQVSNQTAFIIQGNTEAEKIVNTDSTWKAIQNIAYKPCSLNNGERLGAYMVIGPGDEVDGVKYPWNWEQPEYNDGAWRNADEIAHAEPVGFGTDNRWTMAPRNIPVFKEELLRFYSIRRAAGIITNSGFVGGNAPLKLPAHQNSNILLDMGTNTAAYPELILSAGRGSRIKVTYAESLFDNKGNKGNRNEIDNKLIKGNYDVFITDGGQNRKFRPLWLRGYRYLQLDIVTQDEALVLNDIYSMKTGYPLEMNASFASNDPSLQEIWKVGWHTSQLCAGELYYDTPYYEQLQYTGDSRIQALISLYISGDDRLMRKAILDFYHSRTPEGLTQGRYPSNRLQIIPTFSLFWVSMVHDYWMLRKDDAFVKQFLPAIGEIMSWYQGKIDQKKNMLGPLTWWNFVDWDNFNGWGTAPGADKGNSAIITLQYAYTLKQAGDLFFAFNRTVQSLEYKTLATQMNEGTYLACWNPQNGLMSDTPDLLTYSQHAGIWAILSGALPEKEVQPAMQRILTDKTIGQVTFFYRFYLAQALKKADRGDLYYAQLTPWRDMLKLGLTTFAEKPEPTRSDCHAWSASPNYDFLATICGIMPDAPGFEKILIKPALGELTEAEGSMPSPLGKITVHFKRIGKNGIDAEIVLPESLTGTFIWKGETKKLQGGKQHFSLLKG